MNWLYYLLEANLYLALFYGCYHLLFHKETFYSINRYFLIGATLLAFALPLLQIGYLNRFFQPEYDSLPTGAINSIADEGSDLIKLGISSLYWLVAIFFSLKLLRDLYQIIALSRTTKRHHDGQVIHIELEKGKSAFSFFNLLFIPANVAGKETILKHEMVHIRQRHSLDILFFEIIQILNWFNPVSYLIKKDIKLLHEYIADELTTNEEIQKHDYALFLIRNSFGAETKQLSNQIFNPSILKQRINMLNKEKSTGRARFKLLLTLPLVGGMLCTSTMAFTKDYALLDFYPNTISSINSKDNSQDTIKKKPAKKSQLSPAEIRENNTKFPPPIVKPDRPAPRAKHTSKVKFPPPIVKPDRPLSPVKQSKAVPPPPPVDPKVVPVGSAPPPPPVEPANAVDGPPPPPPLEPDTKLRSIELKGKIKGKLVTKITSGEIKPIEVRRLKGINTQKKATTNLETKNTVNPSKP
ncbi:BlaR1 peptidase M56 [Pedobacter steynii]|uniref:BlaR1 peptidase M56 n=2 Tax=Pedobacter steynii TaxID=430522 RepID=A0A1H0B3G0_9SPHI|nr:BlaR1 peptidase M56 [Pedobacter steynii]